MLWKSERPFYGPEEAIIAYNEKRADLHAIVKCLVDDLDEEGNPVRVLKEAIGRILFNQWFRRWVISNGC